MTNRNSTSTASGGCNRKGFALLVSAILFLVTLAAYEPVRHNGFVGYDDMAYVTENRMVQEGLTLESVLWAFTGFRAAFWHPLTWLSLMLDFELFGMNAAGHHAMSVLLHALSAVTLFLAMRRMTADPWPSAFVAAVFALHPLHVESVAWASERKDVLSGLFWMLSMVAYAAYASKPGKLRYGALVLVFCLGLMAKPMLVTLPFVFLLLDVWPLKRLAGPRPGKSDAPTPSLAARFKGRLPALFRLVVEKIPLFALVAAFCVITFAAEKAGRAVMPLDSWSLTSRLLNAPVSYVSYLMKTFVPNRLACLYPLRILDIREPVAAFVILGLLTAGVLYLSRRREYLAVGWLWFLGTLVPVSGLVQLGSHAMADRYMYLPLTGISIMAAWGCRDLLAWSRLRGPALWVVAVIVLSCLLVLTRMQVRHWRNDLTVFGHAVEATKDNVIMRNNYGRALVKAGRIDEGMRQFREALRINPSHVGANTSVCGVLLAEGRVDEAIRCFAALVDAGLASPETHLNLGKALLLKGRFDEAIPHFREALNEERLGFASHMNLAEALSGRGDLAAAIQEYEEALALNPGSQPARLNAERLRTRLGQSGEKP